MSPGRMLLFVFGFVGGAVVINSAILVSLSVLLLVHYSVATGGLPALPSLSSIQRPSRYIYVRRNGLSGIVYLSCSPATVILTVEACLNGKLALCCSPGGRAGRCG